MLPDDKYKHSRGVNRPTSSKNLLQRTARFPFGLLTEVQENPSRKCALDHLPVQRRVRLSYSCESSFSGNNPGIQRDASVAGKTRRNGARALSAVNTPRSMSAETIPRACRSLAPTTPAASPRGSSPRYSTASRILVDLGGSVPGRCRSLHISARCRVHRLHATSNGRSASRRVRPPIHTVDLLGPVPFA